MDKRIGEAVKAAEERGKELNGGFTKQLYEKGKNKAAAEMRERAIDYFLPEGKSLTGTPVERELARRALPLHKEAE